MVEASSCLPWITSRMFASCCMKLWTVFLFILESETVTAICCPNVCHLLNREIQLDVVILISAYRPLAFGFVLFEAGLTVFQV